jgi:hypothetical protein
MYSSWEDIVEERHRRRNDKSLAKALHAFWRHYLPPFLDLLGPDAAILARPVATPNFETILFCENARERGLSPIVLEYPDKFVGFNIEKKFLREMHFAPSIESSAVATHFLFDRRPTEGKLIREILTNTGRSVIDDHHQFLRKRLCPPPQMIDDTSWFGALKQQYHPYYAGFLSVFLIHGVWFENFLLDDARETKFLSETIYPGFCEVCRLFGMRPLIFRHLPIESEGAVEWHYYDLELLRIIEGGHVLADKSGLNT